MALPHSLQRTVSDEVEYSVMTPLGTFQEGSGGIKYSIPFGG